MNVSSKFLHRDDAPFDEKVWKLIDDVVVGAAKSQMAARRFLSIEGPYGLGLKQVPGPDVVVEDSEGAAVAVSPSMPVMDIRRVFTIPARDIAAFEESGMLLRMDTAAQAAIVCARKEDELLLTGSKTLGVEGLLTAKGTQSLELQSWSKVGTAADDIIKGVTMLDDGGFRGPYVLALSPKLYNLLHRRYRQGNMTEMDHLKSIVGGGVVKAPGMGSPGVLLASGKQFTSIVLGQDLMTGFIGPSDSGYEFLISESLALRLAQPKAICILKGSAKS